ncbi:MAG: signal peptidase I [Salibacteraceae bacterium]
MSFIVYGIIALGYFIGFYLLFPKAGRKAWEGIIPIYNFFILTKIIKKPWWWVLLLIFPGVNVIMLMVFNSNLASVYGKVDRGSQIFAIFLPFLAFPMWGNSGIKYYGPIDREKLPKSTMREWGDAIVFAIIAASIIRTYTLEAFTIPTSSMEKSLLIGDYLFVSKLAYGPKIPQTPLSFPFAHHSLPGTTIPSYLEWMKLPYQRLPGFGDVERNDIVVFNYPEGDTVLLQYQSERSYNQVIRDEMYRMKQNDAMRGEKQKSDEYYEALARKVIKRNMPYTVRPVDKREHYIKRCVAIPGDEIFIEHAKLHINGETAYIPPDFQYRYEVRTSSTINKQILKEKLDINYQDIRASQSENGYVYNVPMTLKASDQMETFGSVSDVSVAVSPKGASPIFHIFPNDPQYDWSEDYWGPLTVPEKGTTVDLNSKTLPFYERIIHVYEGHELKVKDGDIFIDGELADSYTFELNYYFMMGDNRHNSADSRFWGFVPEDHVVGKAAFIWLSIDPELGWFDGAIRFNRMFSIPD